MRNEITNATLDLEGIVVLAASIGDEQIELVVESRHDAGCCPSCGRAALEPKGATRDSDQRPSDQRAPNGDGVAQGSVALHLM